jgi:hypothetical protein
MTYNNTVWDKLQSKIWSYLRNIIIGGIAVFYLVSGIINTIRQYQTIRSAEEINRRLEIKVAQLEKEGSELKRKLTEATSSAFMERQVRELLGKGKEDEYWLILPDIDEGRGLAGENFDGEILPPIKMWLNLFTN